MSSSLFNSYVPRDSNSKIAIVLGVASLCLILISTMGDISETMSNNLSLLILVVALLLCFLIQMGVGRNENFEDSDELENEENEENTDNSDLPDEENDEYFSLQENYNDLDKEHFQDNAGESDATQAPKDFNFGKGNRNDSGDGSALDEDGNVVTGLGRLKQGMSFEQEQAAQKNQEEARAELSEKEAEEQKRYDEAQKKEYERRIQEARQAQIQGEQRVKELEARLADPEGSPTIPPEQRPLGLRSTNPLSQCGVLIDNPQDPNNPHILLPKFPGSTDVGFTTIEDDWLTNQAWISKEGKPSICDEAETSRYVGTQARGPLAPRRIEGTDSDPRKFNYDIQLCDAENNKFNCTNLLPGGDPDAGLCETSKEGNVLNDVPPRIIPLDSTANLKTLNKTLDYRSTSGLQPVRVAQASPEYMAYMAARDPRYAGAVVTPENEEIYNWVERRDPITGQINQFIDNGTELMNNAANTSLGTSDNTSEQTTLAPNV